MDPDQLASKRPADLDLHCFHKKVQINEKSFVKSVLIRSNVVYCCCYCCVGFQCLF